MRILIHCAPKELDRRAYRDIRRAVGRYLDRDGDVGRALRIEASFSPALPGESRRCRLRVDVAGRPALVATGFGPTLLGALGQALEGWLPRQPRV